MSEISHLKILKENIHQNFLLDAALPDQTLAIHGILDNPHLPKDIKNKTNMMDNSSTISGS